MLRLLAHYVEMACNGDMTVFLSSGFEAAVRTPKPPQPVATPAVDKVVQGPTGHLDVYLKGVANATHYDLADAVISTGATAAPAVGAGPAGVAAGTPVNWTSQLVSGTKQPVPFPNLQPGTVYAFKVRAYGKLGYSDWSDMVQRMCI